MGHLTRRVSPWLPGRLSRIAAAGVLLGLSTATTIPAAAYADPTPVTSAPAIPTTVVDDGNTQQLLSAPAAGVSSGTVASPTGLLGGTRSVTVGGGDVGGTFATTTLDGVAEQEIGPGPVAGTTGPVAGPTGPTGPVATSVYDGGSDASAPIDPDGLGAVDLTDGGTGSALVAAAASSAPGVSATLTVYSDADDCSTETEAVPVGPDGGNTAIAFRFADLTPAAGCTGPANPSSTGALSLLIDASAAPTASVVWRELRSAALDWGDLPAAWGATTSAEGGAAAIIDPALSLGSRLGGETDGTHSDTSSADPHDDGVTPTPGLDWTAGGQDGQPGGGGLDVTVAGQGCLAVWIGVQPGTDLTAAGDNVLTQDPVTTGTAGVLFPLPPSFSEPATVVVRVRLFPRDLDGSCASAEPLTGVASAGEVEDYVFTLTPPPSAVAFTSLPASPSASLAPSWVFTRPEGTAEGCTLNGPAAAGGAGPVVTAGPCDRGFTARLSGLGDGTYTLAVTATDALDRSAPPSVTTYALSTVAPAAPVILTGPASPSRADLLSWSFTSVTGTTTQCSITGPAVVLPEAACLSGDPVSLAGKPDGTYTFAVTAIDGAGNVSAVSTGTVIRDTQAPGAATLLETPASPIRTTNPTWTFSFPAEDAAIPQCRLSGPGGLVAEWASCPGAYSPTLGQDGSYTFSVRGVDQAGNIGPVVKDTVVLDTTPPLPTITASPANPGRNPVLVWRVKAGENGASARCRLMGPDGTALVDWSGCPSSVSYDETAAADGAYTFEVQSTDVAGNVGPVVTSQVLLDRVVPAEPTITDPPSSPRHDPTVQWTVSGDGDSVLSCALTGPSGVVSAAGACAGSVTYDLAHQPDGDYTLVVLARDQAGNTSPAATDTVTLDRTTPGLSLDSSPVGPSQDQHPTWGFSTDSGDRLACRLTLAHGIDADAFSPCTSPYTADLTEAGDGTYVLTVESITPVGDVNGSLTSSYVLDTTAPAAPTVTASPSSPGAGRAPTWRFSAEPGTVSVCRTVPGDLTAGPGRSAGAAQPPGMLGHTDWTACGSTWTADLSGVADGVLTFQVVSTDAAGNVGKAASSTYQLITAANTPVFTNSPVSPGQQTQVSWSFSQDPGDVASCSLINGATVLMPPAPCTSPVGEDLRQQPDGVLSLVVTSEDVLGNVSASASSTYVLDTTAPPAPTVLVGPATPGTGRSPTWTFSTPPAALDSCRLLQDDVAITEWEVCAGSQSADLTGLPDGRYLLQIRSVDAAGNTSADVTGPAYDLATDTPVAPVITQTPGVGGWLAIATWAFTLPAGSTGTCRLLDGGTVVADWSACSGQATYNIEGLSDGVLAFYARATGGNLSTGPSATAAFVLDRTPPSVPSVLAAPHDGTGSTVSWRFTDDPGSLASCQLSRVDGTVLLAYASCTGTYTADLGARGLGGYVFSVRAADTWGNLSAAASADYVLLAAPADDDDDHHIGSTVARFRKRPPLATPTRQIAPVELARPPVLRLSARGRVHAKTVPVAVAGPPTVPQQHRTVAQAMIRPPIDRTGGPFSGPISRVLGTVLAETTNHVALPLVLIVSVLLFLAIQDRLDRGDPKLATMPLTGGGEWAQFR